MAKILFPVIDIKIGDTTINVPPSNLRELTETLRLTPSVTLTLVDPTYCNLEQLMIQAMSEKKIPISYRFGYPPDNYTNFRHIVPHTVTAEIGLTGYELTVSGNDAGVTGLTQVLNLAFKGKISKVVNDVVDYINNNSLYSNVIKFKTYIEETDDDYNNEHIWNTGDLTLREFITDVLLPVATSKTNKKSVYNFHINNFDNSFHFHTNDYKIASPANQYRNFYYLYGKNDNLISFRPTYSLFGIGASVAQGAVVSTFNPLTKQYHDKALNRKTIESEDIYNETLAPPPDPTDPQSIKKADFRMFEPSSIAHHVIEKDYITTDSERRVTNIWKGLSQRVFESELVLVGLPELINFSPSEQFCNVTIVLPDGSPHPTSGVFKILEVVHSITSTYTVTAQLIRDTTQAGVALNK